MNENDQFTQMSEESDRDGNSRAQGICTAVVVSILVIVTVYAAIAG